MQSCRRDGQCGRLAKQEIAGNSETYIGIAISAHSGHYLNGATIEMSAMSLARAREAFARTGIIFPD